MTINVEQEIIDWYNSFEDADDKADYFYEAWSEFQDFIYGGSAELPSGLTATELERFGGEGKGDQYWVVFQIGDKIYRVDGYYSSWEGANWDSAEPYEVKPVEVTVVKYKKA